MQAWVTNGGLSSGQPVASTSKSGFDAHSGTQKRHSYHSQPLPSQESLHQLRAPTGTIKAGQGTAIAPATQSHHRSNHLDNYRDGSQLMARARTATTSDPAVGKQPPFWEGSTIEGSLGSDTASTVDANMDLQPPYHLPAPEPSHPKPRDIPRQRPFRKVAISKDNRAPFLVGPNGMLGGGAGVPARRPFSPNIGNQYGGFTDLTLADDDQSSVDSPSQSSSPEKASPSKRRLHHPQIPVRASRHGSSERNPFPAEHNPASPIIQSQYQDSEMSEAEPPAPTEVRRVRVKAKEPRRPTPFADIDTPLHGDANSEADTVEQPTPKPMTKAKPQVARQLFSQNGKSKASLHGSPMPQRTAERRSKAKKRPFDLDYDDSVLSEMNYDQLRQEPFDYDPAQAEAHSVDYPPRGTLPEKLEHYLRKDEKTQVDFFAKMPVKDWESSGDWFLERFGDVMHKLTDARRTKRATMEKFETEIAERGQAVKNKAEGIDRVLANLKTEGEGLMHGKEIDWEDE